MAWREHVCVRLQGTQPLGERVPLRNVTWWAKCFPSQVGKLLLLAFLWRGRRCVKDYSSRLLPLALPLEGDPASLRFWAMPINVRMDPGRLSCPGAFPTSSNSAGGLLRTGGFHVIFHSIGHCRFFNSGQASAAPASDLCFGAPPALAIRKAGLKANPKNHIHLVWESPIFETTPCRKAGNSGTPYPPWQAPGPPSACAAQAGCLDSPAAQTWTSFFLRLV